VGPGGDVAMWEWVGGPGCKMAGLAKFPHPRWKGDG
jgi:hypothetical protein